MKSKILSLLSLVFMLNVSSYAQGHVYLVIGSDTAIWDGMNTAEYNCYYDRSLFTDHSMNAYKVMDLQFRNKLKDSYGTPMKMTWWMMTGNIFRYGLNTNVPLANTITLYLMNKYHSESIKTLGDELSMHYHTFVWTDYNKDGRYWWNQAKNFTESADDFKVTLAQFLLEENIFPVSFRSGWHYMDNEWQNYLDPLVPYTLHNDYPNVRVTEVEPIDNVFDWSKASKEFVPYHPSLSNYQLPGDGRSWNTRSEYMGSVSQQLMDGIFAKANSGIDQVPCFWAHLPETNFPDNMERIDSIAHKAAAKYPNVKFRYCTAVEAMQLWRKGSDTTSPELNIEQITSGSEVKFIVGSNEKLFQKAPFIAAKNIYGEYIVLNCTQQGENSWVTTESLPLTSLAKVGAAATDTMGNQSTVFISFRPDDIYIDNNDPVYTELNGNWVTNNNASWGIDSRRCTLQADDSAAVEWTPVLTDAALYNIALQVPETDNPADNIQFRIMSGAVIKKSVNWTKPLQPDKWNYITTAQLDPGDRIEMIVHGNDQAGKNIAADVLKLSALVLDKSISVSGKKFTSNEVSEKDSVTLMLGIQNEGIEPLRVDNIYSVNGYFSADAALPVNIDAMTAVEIPVIFYADKGGNIRDTLVVTSDDPRNPVVKIGYDITVEKYFTVVDNEDTGSYAENGVWSKSNAQAWGSSSRYCWSGTGGSAVFSVDIKYPGSYELLFIVPTTQNAVSALYTIRQGTDTIGTAVADQNIGSGNWVSLGNFLFSHKGQVEIITRENGTAVSNKVLRADAVKMRLTEVVSADNVNGDTPEKFCLFQNYPNPFNNSTKISYLLKSSSDVEINIYNSLGESVYKFTEAYQAAGEHYFYFSSNTLSSGIYFCSIKILPESGSMFRDVKKMILLK